MGYLALLWVVMTVPLLILRPLWPIIETRYVSVAWEMWLRHDFLVPYLNGMPYSHKPPLLFWVIQAGWWLFGVNSWWPRVVPSLFTVGSIIIILRIGRLLWPEHRDMKVFLPFMLFGCLLWNFYMTFVMFDLLVAFSGVLGMYGLLVAIQGKRLPGFFLFGLGIGLGVLSKGPVILVVLLPVALAGPWWGRNHIHKPWSIWYGGVTGGQPVPVELPMARHFYGSRLLTESCSPLPTSSHGGGICLSSPCSFSPGRGSPHCGGKRVGLIFRIWECVSAWHGSFYRCSFFQ